MAASSPNFNFIAPVYDGLAKMVFGDAQQKAQTYFLTRIPQNAQVLILGGGTGLLLAELLQTGLPQRVLYVEASEKMLQKARHRMKNVNTSCTVDFRLGTEKDILPTEKFHAILTPFVLDLFPEEEVKNMIQTLAPCLLPSGLWLHTDFHFSRGLKKQWWQKPLLWAMYKFFRTVSRVPAHRLPRFEPLFRQAGFQQKESAFFFKEFIKATVWQR